MRYTMYTLSCGCVHLWLTGDVPTNVVVGISAEARHGCPESISEKFWTFIIESHPAHTQRVMSNVGSWLQEQGLTPTTAEEDRGDIWED